jgi:hypothetical protein
MDRAVAADHEQRALRSAIGFAIDAIGTCHVAFGLEVGQQRKVQLLLVRECHVTPYAVHRDPQQHGAMGRNLVTRRIEQAHFIATDRTPVRRIKARDDRAARSSCSDTIWSGVACRLKSGARSPA